MLLEGNRRIEMKPAPLLQCPMAEQLALWLRDQAAPRVAKVGPTIASVDSYDDFECRLRNRQITGKVSEHGKADAIDVRGFTLVNGSFIGLTDVDAEELVAHGKAGVLLAGYRGAPPADARAVREVVLRVARLVDDLPEVAELDLNPVIAGPDGCVAVDARVRVGAPSRTVRAKTW